MGMRMRTVAMLIFPGVQMLDVAGPLDVFAEATVFLTGDDGYQVTLIGPDRAPLRASNGMTLVADLSYDEAAGPYDLFLIAGGPALPDTEFPQNLIDCVRRLSAASRIFGSVCTGAFCLGAAGLLDGRKVTTHWQNARRLASTFPKADVEVDRIYLRDGPMITSAGVTAGIDLALSLIRDDHGSALALSVAKRLVVVAQRQGGQSQFSPYVETLSDEKSPISVAAAFVMSNLRERLSVADLATAASMSVRSFARAFVAGTGHPPAEFLEKARIDAARNMLERTDDPLKVIAYECGFGNPKRMRQVFARNLGISPVQYRDQFKAPK
ncbi:Transcriptional regulator GlxA family, contains an amidase domain and an AraC-type DNA-binding HTH domain [Rhizobium lusitanum]|uniref:Transcriptional regulator GlxA family, contains an amidase domain and an AraC-type DNA-binding HTH domain n=2 Tax=Rhizobium/Agrobacterium group TaxID=227290 RepID=A0A1C3VX64_9HYPH|nr:Transcriptional regulator GlxA family, contains an amidase domain and an AraC-type DNA-binding HTH domain [Rhizobium lusitanum]